MYVYSVSGDTTLKMLTVVHYVVILEDLAVTGYLTYYCKLGIPYKTYGVGYNGRGRDGNGCSTHNRDAFWTPFPPKLGPY